MTFLFWLSVYLVGVPITWLLLQLVWRPPGVDEPYPHSAACDRRVYIRWTAACWPLSLVMLIAVGMICLMSGREHV